MKKKKATPEKKDEYWRFVLRHVKSLRMFKHVLPMRKGDETAVFTDPKPKTLARLKKAGWKAVKP